MINARFALGRIVATPGALKAFQEADQEPATFLARHITGDWGELDEHDRKENESSVAQGLRILSAYMWIPGHVNKRSGKW